MLVLWEMLAIYPHGVVVTVLFLFIYYNYNYHKHKSPSNCPCSVGNACPGI